MRREARVDHAQITEPLHRQQGNKPCCNNRSFILNQRMTNCHHVVRETKPTSQSSRKNVNHNVGAGGGMVQQRRTGGKLDCGGGRLVLVLGVAGWAQHHDLVALVHKHAWCWVDFAHATANHKAVSEILCIRNQTSLCPTGCHS